MFCYNCGGESHISKSCHLKQLYTRCRTCSNVCMNESRHKFDCTHKSFISKFVGTKKTVTSIKKIVEMEFRPTDRVVLLSDSTEIDVNENTLWFSEASMGLKQVHLETSSSLTLLAKQFGLSSW